VAENPNFHYNDSNGKTDVHDAVQERKSDREDDGFL
jgi:hypothetical protein